MNYYPFHIGDYTVSTRHLSWEEDAAFRRLLDVYYSTEKPIPLDLRSACRLTLATSESQREAVRIVLEEFFDKTEKGWVNQRVERELTIMMEKAAKQRERANKRWNMPRHEEKDATAHKSSHLEYATSMHAAMPHAAMPPTPTPTPIPEVTPPIPPKGVDDRFAEFWKSYPHKIGKGAAEKAWSRARINGHMPEIMQALEAQKRSDQWTRDNGQFIPNPSTWINQRRWEDDLTTVKAVDRHATNNGAAPWWASNEGIQSKGDQIGMQARSGEGWADFKSRIQQRLNEGQNS